MQPRPGSVRVLRAQVRVGNATEQALHLVENVEGERCAAERTRAQQAQSYDYAYREKASLVAYSE